MRLSYKVLISAIMLLISLPSLAQYQLVQAYPGLTFVRPVDFQHPGDGTDRVFVVQQRGIISVFQNDSLATPADVTTFLDIEARVDDSSDEEGLLGLAFHPDYANNGYFFVNYTANGPNRTVIARFKVSDTDPNVAVADSELVILTVSKPFSNHNAGQIAFGPDGYLYIATGDGGSGGDPQNHGQRRVTDLGNMLRIDVNNSSPSELYRIPSDNPYVGNSQGYLEEIYAYGLRNVWRFSFDDVTGNLWAADVGQNNWEEISIITSGGNYGWKIMEGNHCYPPGSACDTTNLIKPVWEYPHGSGNGSITGGYVYRGNRIPELAGRYIYADYLSGRVWALSYDGLTEPVNSLVVDFFSNIASFGQDLNKNLYICSFNGRIYKIGGSLTGILPPTTAPEKFTLGENYPNPFNPLTLIPFDLSRSAFVSVRIFDVSGKMVAEVEGGELSAGSHSLRWEGTTNTGQKLASGSYFYSLVVDKKVVETRKMTLLQ
ncbi:MAG: PQQ-dependent sugar dehydrogenase [Calditrichia bacterium]